MGHLDPESTGVVDKKFNFNKVAEKLSEYLGINIIKTDDCVGPEAESQSNNLMPGKILLLENLRFYKEETDNDIEFAKKLSYLGDIYVNDAFSVCHRNHASIAGIPQFLPHCAGLLLEKEITSLDKVLKNPEKPMTAIIGGTKVETKSKFIDKISEVADCVIISGLIKKEVQEKNIEFKHPEKIMGPEDNLDALDIDEKTIEMFAQKINEAKTILWNGPFGKFEDEKYITGTLAIAEAIIESGAFSVVGGGETIEFLKKQGIIEKFSHVSTGGGAMLSYLAGETLPGLAVLV
jgi:phosphoglycerate kinase